MFGTRRDQGSARSHDADAQENTENESKNMNRITQLDPATVTGKTKQLFEGVQHKLGIVPNLFRVLGNSSAALEGYLNFSGALAGGVLDAKIREQIALAVAEINDCTYCRSAHTYIGGKVGLSEREMADARRLVAGDPRTEAILNLARSIVVQRGELSESEFKAARAAKLTDAEIVETTANVALNILTNYVNHVAQTVVDFPEVKAGEVEAAAEACESGACACAH
jgi:uncharacterized peroxidase-related enzyme